MKEFISGCVKGVEPFEYNMYEHVDLRERIDWTEEDEELEEGE